MKIYFGHPINTYGTKLEKKLLKKIAKTFPGCEIENPGDKKHQIACRAYKEKGINPMEYFYNEVLPHCDRGIFLPFRDGSWGAGVYGEACWFGSHFPHQCIWRINRHGKVALVALQKVKVLTVSETRARIRGEKGNRKHY